VLTAAAMTATQKQLMFATTMAHVNHTAQIQQFSRNAA
jgi:hypothetical protein